MRGKHVSIPINKSDRLSSGLDDRLHVKKIFDVEQIFEGEVAPVHSIAVLAFLLLQQLYIPYLVPER